MKKRLALISISVLVVMTAVAQKPKATFDHKVFAKQIISISSDYWKGWCPGDRELHYIATTAGQDFGEVQGRYSGYKTTLDADAAYAKKYRISATIDSIGIKILQETPIKIADIITHHHNKANKTFTYTLTNCVQTNLTWVLGDHIVPNGDAMVDFVGSTQAREEKMAGSFLGKMNAAANEQARKDSIERVETAALKKTIKGYQAILFRQQGNDAYTQYIHTDLYNKSLPGYFIDVKGNKTNVDNIRYWEPYTLLIMGPTLGDLASAPPMPIKDILAFYVGDQMFVQYQPGKWAILIGEGAIRRLVTIEKIKIGTTENIIVNSMIQKLGGAPEAYLSLNLGFEKRMSEYVKENQEMAVKIQNHAVGYNTFNLEKIIIEYNKWYDKQFPEKVEYLPLGLEDPDDPADLLPISSKDDLRRYLQNKRWEVASFTSYVENKTPQKIEGVEKVKAAQRYSTYDFFSNGKYYQFGNPSKWSVSDEKTVVMASNYTCTVEGATATTFRLLRKNSDGTKDKTKFRFVQALTPKDLDRYDSVKNFRVRALPVGFRGLVESRPDSVQMTKEGGWIFNKMLKGTADASDQFTFGKINGKPVHMSFLASGSLTYTDGVWRANSISRSTWTYVKATDHNLELKFTYTPESKKKEAVEKYTIVSVTADELIYEDKPTKTRYVWKREK